MSKIKGRVIYEKNGKRYSISDKRFLFLNKHGFTRIETSTLNQILHIYIEADDISNIQFVDCNFDLSRFNIWRIHILVKSENAKVQMANLNYGEKQELLIETQNSITAKNIENGGLLCLYGRSVNIKSIENPRLEVVADDISISDCYGECHSDSKPRIFSLRANKTLNLQNVSIYTTSKHHYNIQIKSPIIEYKNVSFTSGKIDFSNLFSIDKIKKNSNISEGCISNYIYTVDDTTLERLEAVNRFYSDLKGFQEIIKEQIKTKTKDAEEAQQQSVGSKIKALEEEIVYLSELKEIAKEYITSGLEKQPVSTYVKEKSRKQIIKNTK